MIIKLMQVREATGQYANSPSVIVDQMKSESQADREGFWVLHLNTRLEIIEKELVALGSLESAIVHPREVFRKAILNSSASIITVHNHPGGSLVPSADDKIIWDRLAKAGEIIGIEVIDNLIITPKGGYYSQKLYKG